MKRNLTFLLFQAFASTAIFLLSSELLKAQDVPSPAADETAVVAPASETPSEPAPSVATAPAPETPSADAFLALEKSAATKTPEIFAKLPKLREFSKRLPNYWRALQPTKKQTTEIYAIQLDYFLEIANLQARIARLETERDARMRAVLTEKQRAALDAKLAEVEKSRAEKQAAREAEDDAEVAE